MNIYIALVWLNYVDISFFLRLHNMYWHTITFFIFYKNSPVLWIFLVLDTTIKRREKENERGKENRGVIDGSGTSVWTRESRFLFRERGSEKWRSFGKTQTKLFNPTPLPPPKPRLLKMVFIQNGDSSTAIASRSIELCPAGNGRSSFAVSVLFFSLALAVPNIHKRCTSEIPFFFLLYTCAFLPAYSRQPT